MSIIFRPIQQIKSEHPFHSVKNKKRKQNCFCFLPEIPDLIRRSDERTDS